jgi:CRP/FNR family transcriptional regulator
MEPSTVLTNCALFRGLDSAEINRLADVAQVRRIAKGDHLFWEGEPAIGFYVLIEGVIRVYKSSPDGKEITLHRIRPGQMFAEAAIFSDGGFPANCAAISDATVAFFPKDRFITLLGSSPSLSLKIIAGLSAFVREFSQKVRDLSLREVSGRLAGFLLTEQRRQQTDTIYLETTKAELANSLGTTSESLSRNLKSMRELGIISVTREQVVILDSDSLIALAEGEKYPAS